MDSPPVIFFLETSVCPLNHDLEAWTPLVRQIASALWKREDIQKIGDFGDVFQIGLMSCFKAMEKAKELSLDPSKLKAYIRTSVNRGILREASRAAKWSYEPLDGVDVEVVPSEEGKDVRDVLSKLEPYDAMILRWAFGVGRARPMPSTEIAKILGVTPVVARRKLRIAKKKFEEVYGA